MQKKKKDDSLLNISLEDRLAAQKRREAETIGKLVYYERLAAAARVYRLLEAHLPQAHDGGLANGEDYEFLEHARRMLDRRIADIQKRPWSSWGRDSGKENEVG